MTSICIDDSAFFDLLGYTEDKTGEVDDFRAELARFRKARAAMEAWYAQSNLALYDGDSEEPTGDLHELVRNFEATAALMFFRTPPSLGCAIQMLEEAVALDGIRLADHDSIAALTHISFAANALKGLRRFNEELCLLIRESRPQQEAAA